MGWPSQPVPLKGSQGRENLTPRGCPGAGGVREQGSRARATLVRPPGGKKHEIGGDSLRVRKSHVFAEPRTNEESPEDA
jgi:hypothetical protein